MRHVSGAGSARERQRADERWGVGAQPPLQRGAGDDGSERNHPVGLRPMRHVSGADMIIRWGSGRG